jgi:hypothetical protein
VNGKEALVKTTTGFVGHRPAALAAALVAALVAGVVPRAGAQEVRTDPHWAPWLGCWTPVAEKERSGTEPTRALLVCVVPAIGSAGVDIATVADTQVVSSDRVDATGARIPVERDGCSGWESAQWSSDGARVYVRSELSCQGNLRRRSSGVMALSDAGEWLDVRSMTAGTRRGVRVLRYQAAPLPETLPAQIAAALRGAEAVRAAAPLPPSGPLTTADVAEASRQMDTDAVEAWLAESGQDFRMNAGRLLGAKRAGIPGDVIDVMVALSYPRVFTIDPASGEAQLRQPAPGESLPSGYSYAGPGYGYRWGGYYYNPYGWDAWWPYGWNSYNPIYGYSPYGPYGYGPWYGGYGWYGGYYYGGGGVVIVNGYSGTAVNHGQVVKGRGYTPGGVDTGRGAQPRGTPTARAEGGSSGGRSAEPRSQPAARGGDSGGRRSTGSAQPSSGGSQPSSGGSQPSSRGSSSSSGSSSSGRTAHPRPPR